jgi:hypothetical protein
VDIPALVEVSFFGGIPFPYLYPPQPVGSDWPVRVASVLDVGAYKIQVVQHRAAIKDYLDVIAILDAGVSLGVLLRAAEVKFKGKLVLAASLRALTYFDDPELTSLSNLQRKQLKAAVQDTNLAHLPPLPSPRPSA